jgi:hypothetical protein
VTVGRTARPETDTEITHLAARGRAHWRGGGTT